MEVNGWRLQVGKETVRIYDDDDVITDKEAINIIKYLYDEGMLSSLRVECIIVTK